MFAAAFDLSDLAAWQEWQAGSWPINIEVIATKHGSKQ